MTNEQAVKDILALIDSPLLPDMGGHPGQTFQRIYVLVRTDAGGFQSDTSAYDCLSSGEKALVDIAYSLWRGNDFDGARVCAIGWLDKGLRATVLRTLTELYVGDLAGVK